MKKTILLGVLAIFVLSAWAQDSSKVAYFSSKQMDADLHKLPLNEIGESEINLIERTPGHAAILLRRTLPGKAEVHENQADVWYVIDGGCEFVTGGKVVDGKPESPGETRGTGISGGDEHHLAKGDFIRVPAGVPHWVKKIEQHTTVQEKIATSVDLPLSNESKRVLAYAAEEAERLEHKHIGTEHLLLGLMREKESFAAQLLNEAGLELQDARRRVGEGVAKGVLGGDVQGGGPANLFLRMQIDQLRKFAWHKREWKALDVFRQDGTGLASFDPTVRDDPTFKFAPGGWPKDWCAICNWEFNDDPEHSIGYTNGRLWICSKCYGAFLGPDAKPESV